MSNDNKGKKEQENYRPALAIYHGNSKNTGAAMAIRMYPATLVKFGYLQLELAAQKTASGTGVFPTFDWTNRIVIRLTPFEAGEIAQCIMGHEDRLREGAGLVHQSEKSITKFTLEHLIEPEAKYRVEISQHLNPSGSDRNISISLTRSEAITLSMAIKSVMGQICFG